MIGMEPIISNQRKVVTLFGFSKVHDQNKGYSHTIFELMDKVWKEVRENGLSHKGMNHVVYEDGHHIFAGIELVLPLVIFQNWRRRMSFSKNMPIANISDLMVN